MAEALVAVADPLLTALRPGPWSTGEAVTRALARSLLPEEDPAPPPGWLLPAQARSFRRLLAAIGRFHGALLADPVGSGKTYVALAVAQTMGKRVRTACLVPASLVAQWEVTAARLGVPVAVASHQRVSRGGLPSDSRGLVIIDESHHFRNPRTRRYLHLAPWLVGRPLLLLTATPVVNRLSDLAHQLLLGIRDDALTGEGVGSLHALLRSGAGAPALGRVVFEGVDDPGPRPARRVVASTASPAECAQVAAALDLVDRLRLSHAGPVATLVRGVLRRAAGSSPAALAGALRRYRRLLLHARDASRAGRQVDREELRRFTDGVGDQLLLWELLPDGGGACDLDLADLERIDVVVSGAVAACGQADPKADRLEELLADGVPTLVFAGFRETVRHLRDHLGQGGYRVAWCTGDRAGLGSAPAPRTAVLGWFREGVGEREVEPGLERPRHLLVTDVAAEGLDLQRAARVIHYDLPWTPMRLEQREGRAVRLGSAHSAVDVVRLTPPPELEREVGVGDALRRKARLPGLAGFGAAGRGLWRWRTELGERLGGVDGTRGVALVESMVSGVLAGFTIQAEGRGPAGATVLGSAIVWVGNDGRWTEDPEVVTARLSEALASRKVTADSLRLRRALELIAPPVRVRLATVAGRRWSVPSASPPARLVAARLVEVIADTARQRDGQRLARLEALLAFVSRGHTAGETVLLERMSRMDGEQLDRMAIRVPPPDPRWSAAAPSLTGLLIFGPA